MGTVADFLAAHGGWLTGILNMSYMGSLVILFVLAARLLLRKAPKRFSYILWAVVLFRLLCPFSPQSTLSLLPGYANPVPEPVWTADAYPGGDSTETGRTPAYSPNSAGGTDKNNAVQSGENRERNLLAAGMGAWLAGAAAMALYSLISWRSLRRKLKVSLPCGDGIYWADGIPTPFVAGIRKPKIYLPSGIGEEEKAYAVLHENAHIRRKDPVFKALAWLALCLHWFNPLVWLAYFCAQKDMEMSCDEAVLEKAGEDIRKPYSASLLNLTAGRRVVGVTPLAFGEGNTKSRIRNILSYKKPGFYGLLTAGGVAAVLIFGLIVNPGGVKTTIIEDKEELTGTEARWYEEVRQSEEQGLYLMTEEGSVLAYFRGGDGYSYYQVKAQVSGSRMRIMLKEKNASTEGEIVNEILFRVPCPDRVWDYTVTLDGEKMRARMVSDYHDWVYPTLEELYDSKNPYIGDASADGRLLKALHVGSLGAYTIELQTSEEPYVLTVCFENEPEDPETVEREMSGIANILLALIDNCGEVRWSYPYTDPERGEVLYTGYWGIDQANTMAPFPIKECGSSLEKLERLLIYQGGRTAEAILNAP
jgi:beta-lactamase regulating signal transducer with metallopeptidase domain